MQTIVPDFISEENKEIDFFEKGTPQITVHHDEKA